MSNTSDCPKCGAPRGMIGWLCGCWYEHFPTPQWMIDDYKKKISTPKPEREVK